MGEKFQQTTSVPAPTQPLVNALDPSAQDSATQSLDSVTRSIVPPAAPSAEAPASQARAVSSDEIPIGVLEVPVGVWGSRRGASVSGQAARVEVFAEETCTVIVFPYGAVIRLSAAVAPGQMMMLTNRETQQVTACRVVKSRNYSNVKGYAEIEFFRSTKGFWGDYAPQGVLKLTAEAQAAAAEKFADDFWDYGSRKEAISALADAWAASTAQSLAERSKVSSIESRATQSNSADKAAQRATLTTAPQRQRVESASERSWIRELVSSLPGQITSPNATDRNLSPRRRMAFAWVAVTCLLLVGAGATGLFLRHRGAAQRAAATEPASATEESLAQSAGNTPATAQIESNSTSAASAVPFDAKTENFPGGQSQGFADNARASQPSAKILSLGKLLNAKPLAAPVVARRSATALGREAPPNLTGVNSNPGAAANRGILSAFLPAGGRVKEPHLVLSSVPNYPVLAKRAGIEGEVTVAAVIDINGKLTSMTVVSGSPLLQQAALDSLRTWKYEPAYLNDKPVPVQTSVTVKFRLH